jgi:hypothetical protein
MTTAMGLAKRPKAAKGSYVKVEIRGRLDVTWKIITDWKQFVGYDGIGVSVLAPGHSNDDVFYTQWLDWRGQDGQEGKSKRPGISWRLFLGGSKSLARRARALKGKVVIVKGRVVVIGQPEHPVGGDWRPWVAVKVTSLRAAGPNH